MAAKYTYEDVLKVLGDGYMSDADRRLAQENPDAGMSIAQAKKDYAAATTDEQRLAANRAAENIRKNYGGYTGGADGSGFMLYNPTPDSFAPSSAPTYQSSYSQTVQDLMGKQQNYGSFTPESAPTYQNNYSQTVQDLMGKQQNYAGFNYDTPAPVYEAPNRSQELLNEIINNQQKFSYDPNTDPSYAAYKKEYAREGQRAANDTLGAAAAASGGIPSSYAVTAAGQAANYYAAQMADKIPELYNQAYNRFLQENQRQLQNYQALRDQENDEYNRYLNQLSQYNTDRNFAYGQYNDDYNRLRDALESARTAENTEYNRYLNQLSQYNTDRNFAYGQYNDDYNRLTDALNSARAAENDEYNRYLNQLSQYNTDRNFSYEQLLDEITNRRQQEATQRDIEQQEYQRRYNEAVLAAQYGDYSLVEGMGITPDSRVINADLDNTEYQRRYNEAMLAAQYGDYSLLRQLGIEPNFSNINNEALASGGKYYGSGTASGGSASSSGGGGGGSSYNNEGLTTRQIEELQNKLGVTADGKFGKNSLAAAKAMQYNSATEAYNALVGGSGGSSSGGTNPNKLTRAEFNARPSYQAQYGTYENYLNTPFPNYESSSSSANGLSSSEISTIKQIIGGTKLTQSQANQITSTYGISEADLKKAGFSIK